jgi:outer membrane protein, heavy metal efflux system
LLHRRFLLLLVGAFAIVAMSFAYADTLTLDQAIEWALQNNPQLKASQAQLGISDADILTAAARLNPKLLSDNGFAEDTYRMGIEQTLELGGKRHKRVMVARAQKQVLSEDINQSILDLKAQVRRAYAGLYYNQQRQLAYREILDITDTLVTIASKREKAGDVAMLDVLQADIAKVNANNDLQNAANSMVIAWNNLNAALNKPLEHRYELTPPPIDVQTPLILSGLLEKAFQHRPELKQLENKVTAAETEQGLALANRIPNLSLSLGPDIVTSEGNDNQVNVFAIASMDLPIWNRQQGPIQQALAKKNQLTQEKLALANIIQLEVSNAYNSLTTQQTRLMHYETEILPKAHEIVEKSRRSFGEGKSNILVPLSAQQAYINARLGYLQTLNDLQNALSDLERATGAPL